jgi:hypothetical protein
LEHKNTKEADQVAVQFHVFVAEFGVEEFDFLKSKIYCKLKMVGIGGVDTSN